MPKKTYLHKRAKSAVYYFRCRIPNDLLSCYEDKREIIYSLKTRDHHEAMRRVAIEAGKQQIEFEDLRRSLVNAQNPPKRACTPMLKSSVWVCCGRAACWKPTTSKGWMAIPTKPLMNRVSALRIPSTT